MIQFNLLPDVKQQYIKAKRQKHTVIVVSLLMAASSLFIFTMLFLTVNIFQKAHLRNLDDDIQVSTKSLNDIPDLNKVLTIQNQLNSLPGLHDKKPVTSRLFGYMSQITPANVTIGNLSLNYAEETITITGQADSLSTVNKFVDTIKFTSYKIGEEDQQEKPFSEVVLGTFARDETEATYTINFKFKPDIFDSSKDVKLVIPKIISTRSETEKPGDLFKELPKPEQQR
ncbi:hypothetical protein EKI60_04305 [Candidatus Saccharibacteria bacterium]|nr:MAG: hypothetical protein EKI60_04305 [Candidatus Saccharibacteria bacterium]